MKEAHRFHCHRRTFRRKPVGPEKMCAVAPTGPSRQVTMAISTPVEFEIGAAFVRLHSAAAHVNTAPATPFIGAALFNIHRT